MKKRKIAILLSALMLYTNISYVGIDGNAEEILLEEPETLLNESTEKETEVVPAGRSFTGGNRIRRTDGK